LAIKPIGRGRAAVLERVAIGLEALKGQIALRPGHWANAVNRALFGVHDGVGPLGIEWAGDRLGRIVVGQVFLFAPQLAGVDQRANGIVIPQQGLGLGAVQPPIGTEVPTAGGQFRGLAEGGADHRAQGGLFGHRGGRHRKRHGDFVAGIGDQMQSVAEPALDLLPGLAGAGIDAVGLVITPLGIGVGSLAALVRAFCPVL